MINDILNDIKNSKVKKVVLDTDAANEVDDQFAIAYAMRSQKIDLLSVNSAPFVNKLRKTDDPETGMLKSYDEILKIKDLTDPSAPFPVYYGSTRYLDNSYTPVDSPAADNIINTVKNSKETVYIVAIGTITNVASAIIKAPEIMKNAVIIWLGGHSFENADPYEFNMRQDIIGAKQLFDFGMPFIHIPARGVTSNLRTTLPELEYCIGGKNPLCDYLINIVKEFILSKSDDGNTYARSRVIWDLAGIACLAVPDALTYSIIPAPIIKDDGLYSHSPERHPYIYVSNIDRDKVFRDVFPLLF